MRYTLALAITTEITLLRYVLDSILSDSSIYAFYIASVIVAAWYLGLGPSLLNLVTGAATASYLFARPRGSLLVSDLRHFTGLITFLLVGWYLAYLIHWLRRDIARRQKAEAELVAAQELLQGHQAELAHAARLSLMGEMAASLAHELNQPLHSARNYAQGSIRRMRKHAASDPEVLSALEKISEATDRGAKILRRVRDLANKNGPCLEDLALDNLIAEAVTIANMGPGPSRAKVVLEIAGDLPPAQGDPVEIEQVIVNLARNGLEAMCDLPESERVLRLGAHRGDDNTIEVYVRDCGAGIPADAMPAIFEPFFSTKEDGMGMGLAICRSIIARHEGQLWVTANDDRGCTFHFTLPVKESLTANSLPTVCLQER